MDTTSGREPEPDPPAGGPAGPPGTSGTSATHQVKRIGWLLAWAVVFCDIGTSVYYVPGILYHHVGDLAPFFVLLVMGGFLLLAQKYTEVSWRNPEGGGVVTVARKAFGSWWGCLGGILITIDYFLTSAISSVSGFAYLASVFKVLQPHTVELACGGLVLLCVLNIVGIRESAMVALGFALASLLANTVVMAVGIFGLKAYELDVLRHAGSQFSRLPVREILIGFAGTWLAFSGLESISQLSPSLKLPTRRTVRYAMFAVLGTVLMTSPVLTALSIAVIPGAMKAERSDSFISDLALARAGPWMQVYVVAAAAALLLFAANTAMIGGYHVFLALARERFFPRILARRSTRFSTPHWAILITTAVPIATILAARGDLKVLGDMYAFGLLGAFTFTALGLDVIRWREKERGWLFGLGILATLLVAGSWGINMFAKPLATIYGGGLTIVGLILTLSVRREWVVHALNRIPFIANRAVRLRVREEYAVEEEYEIVSIRSAVAMRRLYPSTTLVAVLGVNEKLIGEAVRRVKASGERALFLITVTEWPGLFSGAETRPSPDAVRALNEMGRMAKARGIFVVPVWGISDSAARAIADAAVNLECTAVMMGVSQRGAIYHMLRGSLLRGLARHLPEECRILTIG